jgi:hypothetical protein
MTDSPSTHYNPVVEFIKQHPKFILLVYYLIKYNLFWFSFEHHSVLLGLALVACFDLYYIAKLFSSLTWRWDRVRYLSVVAFTLAFVLFWQVRKYLELYETLQYQLYFRMWVWTEPWRMFADPYVSTVLAIHMDASFEMLTLHLFEGLQPPDVPRSQSPEFDVTRYNMAVLYFAFTLPYDAVAPNPNEHEVVHVLYRLNMYAITLFLLLTAQAFFKGFGERFFNTKWTYWLVLVLLLAHPVYDLFTHVGIVQGWNAPVSSSG